MKLNVSRRKKKGIKEKGLNNEDTDDNEMDSMEHNWCQPPALCVGLRFAIQTKLVETHNN